jgi:hypothetical protein
VKNNNAAELIYRENFGDTMGIIQKSLTQINLQSRRRTPFLAGAEYLATLPYCIISIHVGERLS